MTGSRYGALKALGIGASRLVVTLLLFAAFSGVFGLFLVASTTWDNRMPYASVRNAIGLPFIIGLAAMLHQGVKYEAPVVPWLASRPVKPIPLG